MSGSFRAGEGDSAGHEEFAGEEKGQRRYGLSGDNSEVLVRAKSGKQPWDSYFGRSYVSQSPAGPWCGHTEHLLFQRFPGYTDDQQHGIIYTLARV